MAYRLVALRSEGTTDHLSEVVSSADRAIVNTQMIGGAGGECVKQEGPSMKSKRLRRISGIRFELVQQVRAKIASGQYGDEAIDACLAELLADLA